MDDGVRGRLCRLAEEQLPTPETVAAIADNDPEMLRDIADSYSSCPSERDNLHIRRAAEQALERVGGL